MQTDNDSGLFGPVKKGFSEYLSRWFAGLYAESSSTERFIKRGFTQSCLWCPSRMVDKAEQMLDAYQKSANTPNGKPAHGKSTPFPVLLAALDPQMLLTGADQGGVQVPRQLLQFRNGSHYGYRQVSRDKRVQLAIIADTADAAEGLAAQLAHFVKQNRAFQALYSFAGEELAMPVVLEDNQLDWMDVKTGYESIRILAADITLHCNIPYFDAPRAGEPNDGSANTPPGYPVLTSVESPAAREGEGMVTTAEGTD